MEPGTSILVAAGVAVLGWVYTNRTTQHTSRRQHTFQFFYDFKMDDKNSDETQKTMDLARNKNIPNPFDETRQDDYRLIDKVLDHYEYVSSAIFNGDMDESFVFSVDGSMFIELAKAFNQYITDSRERQPSVYCNLTNLADRWASDNRTWLQSLYEWWKMRPYTVLPIHVRWLNYKLI